MKTKFIGMKELRQNMAKVAQDAQKKGERVIVLRKNEPMFELRPLGSGDKLAESFAREIKEAQEEVKRGEVFTHEEMRKRLGL